jgi:hypothetical protein
VYRIDHPTAAAALPAPSAAGTPGYFQGGDPSAGTARTVVTQDWANLVQEELVTVALAAGAPLSKTDTGQVLKGVKATVAGMFTQVLGGAGYLQLPSGLVVKWGNPATVTGSGDPIAFPLAFANACFVVLADEANAAGWNINQSQATPTIYGVSNVKAGGFNISCLRVGPTGSAVYVANSQFNYIALGY